MSYAAHWASDDRKLKEFRVSGKMIRKPNETAFIGAIKANLRAVKRSGTLKRERQSYDYSYKIKCEAIESAAYKAAIEELRKMPPQSTRTN
jgi:hypothetical protein